MDEVLFIIVICFCCLLLVIVFIDCIDFNYLILVGLIVELVGWVVKVGNISFKVEVEVYLESMYVDGCEKVIYGLFSFVVIDDEKWLVLVLLGFLVSQVV